MSRPTAKKKSKKKVVPNGKSPISGELFYKSISIRNNVRTLHFLGCNNATISKRVGVDPETVARILNSVETQLISQKLQTEYYDKIYGELLLGKSLIVIGKELDREADEARGFHAWEVARNFKMMPAPPVLPAPMEAYAPGLPAPQPSFNFQLNNGQVAQVTASQMDLMGKIATHMDAMNKAFPVKNGGEHLEGKQTD